MRSDSLKQYVSLRQAIAKEKAQLEERLEQINQVLQTDGPGNLPDLGSSGLRLRERGIKRIRNKISLREAVLQVTAKKALTKQEILQAIGKLGYKFTSDKPMNSLNAVLYANKQFKNANGRFSPA
ncbi:MAG: hypothetical protein M2R45_02284 [Verrucomicrobia subdivision 3 bacterium]|nr:hypothetical protein [Limisphaerales bacterium]MCS1414663.1 hypothetical protein [Limisphaerales bacterium]